MNIERGHWTWAANSIKSRGKSYQKHPALCISGERLESSFNSSQWHQHIIVTTDRGSAIQHYHSGRSLSQRNVIGLQISRLGLRCNCFWSQKAPWECNNMLSWFAWTSRAEIPNLIWLTAPHTFLEKILQSPLPPIKKSMTVKRNRPHR